MGKSELLVDGKPFVLDQPHARSVERMLTFLDALPDNQVLTIKEFNRLGRIGENALYDNRHDPALKNHIHISAGRRRIFFGNPRAIQTLKALYAAEQK